MKIKILFWVLLFTHTLSGIAQKKEDWRSYSDIIKQNIYEDYKGMYRDSGMSLPYPFLVPGSKQYGEVLWDWDSWLSNVALRQVLMEKGSDNDKKEAVKYEQGCILNFLSHCDIDGWIPVLIDRDADLSKIKPKDIYKENMHKPCLAQHAAFLVKTNNGDVEWLRKDFHKMQYFVNNYIDHRVHTATGLAFWQTDHWIGVDNDPSTFYRPDNSSASIYLNTMLYKELEAMVYLCRQLKLNEVAAQYKIDADKLKAAIAEHCWDERDGFYYSVDLNLRSVNNNEWFHRGAPRTYHGLIQRIGVWSGFMAMWAGIATPEQANRMVTEHFKNEKTFNATFGIRTLSKMEKMYNLKASGNPSSWQGPIWGVSNYLTWKGLVKYGFRKEAEELAAKTIILFGKDFKSHGALHEYYEPDNGTPVLNQGFQNWNYLVLNMLAWLEGRSVVEEF